MAGSQTILSTAVRSWMKMSGQTLEHHWWRITALNNKMRRQRVAFHGPSFWLIINSKNYICEYITAAVKSYKIRVYWSHSTSTHTHTYILPDPSTSAHHTGLRLQLSTFTCDPLTNSLTKYSLLRSLFWDASYARVLELFDYNMTELILNYPGQLVA